MDANLDSVTSALIYKTLYHMCLQAWRKRKEMVRLEMQHVKKIVKLFIIF